MSELTSDTLCETLPSELFMWDYSMGANGNVFRVV